jgi:hypothetical protein
MVGLSSLLSIETWLCRLVLVGEVLIEAIFFRKATLNHLQWARRSKVVSVQIFSSHHLSSLHKGAVGSSTSIEFFVQSTLGIINTRCLILKSLYLDRIPCHD